jgi:hypothetical protein
LPSSLAKNIKVRKQGAKSFPPHVPPMPNVSSHWFAPVLAAAKDLSACMKLLRTNGDRVWLGWKRTFDQMLDGGFTERFRPL